MPESTTPHVCLPAELYGKDREQAAQRAVRDRPDNAPSWRAVQELSGAGLIQPAQPSGAVFLTGALWPEGKTITVSFMGVSDSDQDFIREHLDRLYGYTNLSLQWVGSDGEIRIATEPGGSWSYIGSQAGHVDNNRQTLNLGWLNEGVVLHEGGHSIGMGHGHKNPETPWQWNEEAVYRDLSGPPNNWNQEQIKRNVLDRYTAEEVTASDPDFDSVMAYTVPNAWTIGDYEVARNDDLSSGDIAWLRKTYPTKDEPTGPTDPPEGDDMKHLLVIQGKGPNAGYSVHVSGEAEFTEQASASRQENDTVTRLADGTSIATGIVAGGRDALAFDGRILSLSAGDERVTFALHHNYGA